MIVDVLVWVLLGLQGMGVVLAAEPPSAAEVYIAPTLQQVVARMQQDGLTAANVLARQPHTYSTPLVQVDAQGRLHTAIMVTHLDAQVEAALTVHAVVIERTAAALHLIQAWVPFDRLTTVATLPFVRSLRPPSYASRR